MSRSPWSPRATATKPATSRADRRSGRAPRGATRPDADLRRGDGAAQSRPARKCSRTAAPLGKAGQALRLPAARTDLEVRLAGFQPHRTAVTPRPGLPQVINVRLQLGRDASECVEGSGCGRDGRRECRRRQRCRDDPTRWSVGRNVAHQRRARSCACSVRRISRWAARAANPGRRANESQRAVELRRRFYLGTREVTNAEFKQFRPQHRSGYVGQNTLETERQPVGQRELAGRRRILQLAEPAGRPARRVPDAGAASWCWCNPARPAIACPRKRNGNGRRAPIGTARLRKYPWGDALPVPAGAGNFADRRAQPLLQTFLEDLDDG